MPHTAGIYNYTISKGASWVFKSARASVAQGQFLSLALVNAITSGVFVVVNQVIFSYDATDRPGPDGELPGWAHIVGLPNTSTMTPDILINRRASPPTPPVPGISVFRQLGARVTGPFSPFHDISYLIEPGLTYVDSGLVIGPGSSNALTWEATYGPADMAITVFLDILPSITDFTSTKANEPVEVTATGLQVDVLHNPGSGVQRAPVLMWIRFGDGTIRGCVATAAGALQDGTSLPGFIGYAVPGTPGLSA